MDDTTARRDAEIRQFWFESHGTQLFAVERGSGRPLVFLHGALANHLAALRAIERAAERLRVIAPDLRGSGRSIYPGPLSWDRLAEDVASLLDHLGLERAVVGGASSGASVAARFALRFPERTSGLVLLQPIDAGCDRTPEQTAVFDEMDALGQRALVEGVEVFRPLYMQLPPEIRDRALALLREFDAAGLAATTHLLARGPHPFGGPDALLRIEAPTLLVPGNDNLHPASVSSLLAEQIRRCVSVATLDAATLTRFVENAGRKARVHLIVGPVGAGKSTFAQKLCRERRAIHFVLDEWMTQLFRPDRPDTGVMEWYRERARRCIEQIWRLTVRSIEAGTDAVLEIGLIQRRDREWLYEHIAATGYDLTIYVLDAPRDVRRERVERRNQEQRETFSMIVPPDVFELASDLWEPLDQEECQGRDVRVLAQE